MHNVWLIARREYMERIHTRGFIVTTVLIPLLMAASIFSSTLLGSKAKTHIVVVSSDTQLALDLQTELQSDKKSRIVADAMGPGADTRRELDEDFDSNAIDGYLWITPGALPSGRPNFTYTPRSAGDNSTESTLASALHTVLIREQLAHRGVIATDVDSMLLPVKVETVKGGRHADTASSYLSVMVLFFLMYMVIMLYGMNVARSIIEEKTSRIFEVLLATIRPEEMMAGKIIGVGSVGLTQVAIWLLAGLLLSSTRMAADLGGESVHLSLSVAQVVFFFIYFTLGYLFYSSIAAALGAMTNSEQELQQLNMFLVLPLAVCAIALHTVMGAPDGTVARTLALIPPFTPLIMYLRVSLGHPAVWEIGLSIVLTGATILTIVWITSRIYRVGVLMYGKRPNLPEILRWLKYS
jgi:ABC-2 type transport system permease protein